MSNLNKTLQSSKSSYGTPSLITYGKLADRTRVFGLPNPESFSPDDNASTTCITV